MRANMVLFTLGTASDFFKCKTKQWLRAPKLRFASLTRTWSPLRKKGEKRNEYTVTIHHEVHLSKEGAWRLCFQWCTYTYDDGSPDEDGYRLTWRRPDSSRQPARGQARIPPTADIFELLQMAARAGWLTTVEGKRASAELADRAD